MKRAIALFENVDDYTRSQDNELRLVAPIYERTAKDYAIIADTLREKAEREANPGEVSDGYHTFNELYHHRAVLFSVICNQNSGFAWKSKQHHVGGTPMYDGMFVCGIETPNGQATYHYDIEPYWNIFNVQELDCAPEWDGHTPNMALDRIMSLALKPKGGCE